MADESRPIPLTKQAPATVERAAQTRARGETSSARLSIRFADGSTSDVILDRRTTMGRLPTNTIRLMDNVASKVHCVFEPEGVDVILRDLGSTNGTFVDGLRISAPVALRPGNTIVVGNCEMRFHPTIVAGGPTSSWGNSDPAIVARSEEETAVIASLPNETEEFRPVEELHAIELIRQDYEKLRIANQFHRIVGGARDVKSVLDKIMHAAFEILPADNVVVFSLDENGNFLFHGVERRSAHEAHPVVVSATVLNRVKESGEAVLTADAAMDARFSTSESIIAQGIRSAMAVPLMSKGKLRGALFCDTRVRTNAFAIKDLKVLAGIASQAAVALENAELAQEIERSALTRAELSRFLAPAVADAVIAGKVELLRAGRSAEITVIFADIRGFTRLAESDPPELTAAMLNTFFTAMANVIFKHEGNLDKFIGDCVMATWGPPKPHTDDAARALRCALEMQEAVEEMNAQRRSEALRSIGVGIGVNTGQAVVGYFGSNERHEFSAIGDSVNTASRLCDLAVSGEILASEATVKAAGHEFRVQTSTTLQIKGKEHAVVAYRVIQ